jgi:hypothetical protein
MATATVCVNHPQTETLLRCNKCGKPVCIKCVQLTPVGYRCKECLQVQRVGYYNATPVDYIAAGLIGIVVSAIGGFVMALLGGFWLLAIFAGPIGGGIVAEAIRTVVRKHRGQYLWLLAGAVILVGGVVGLAGFPLASALATGKFVAMTRSAGVLFNLGFWIYAALAVSTAAARLRG